MTKELPGHGLRQIREKLGLTLKDVEAQSRGIAEARQNQEYLFTAGRLSQVENSFSLPSLYKLATLSQIYQIPYRELLRFYGIETEYALPPLDSVESIAGPSGRGEHAKPTPSSSKLNPTSNPVWA